MAGELRDALSNVSTTPLSEREEALLSEMGDLAHDSGDWRDHLPYEAAVAFHGNESVQQIYGAHVDECELCSRLVHTINPPEKVLAALRDARSQAELRAPDEASQAPWIGEPAYAAASASRGWSIGWAVLAAAFGILGTLGVQQAVVLTADSSASGEETLQVANVLATPSQDTVYMVAAAGTTDEAVGWTNALAVESLIANPDLLVSLEASSVPSDRFLAARYYLATEHPDLAYQRISEGLALANVSGAIVEEVQSAPRLVGAASASLMSAAQATMNSTTPQPQLTAVRSHAQLGQHAEAMKSLESYLIENGVDNGLVDELKQKTVGDAAQAFRTVDMTFTHN